MDEEKTLVKPLGTTSIEELTGVTAKGGDIVLVNLNRAAMVIECGSSDDFIHAISMTNGVKAAVWNEKGIQLALADRYTIMKYEPPIHENASMFFEPLRSSHFENNQWKGNYKPVVFTKKDLIQFLKEADVTGGTENIVKAVQAMKLRETQSETSLISLDEDNTTTTTEERFETNIPKRFSLVMPVTPDFAGEFKFEVRVEKPSKSGGDATQRKISLHCLNPLEIQRAAIKHVLDQIPKEIPRLYGNLKVTTRDNW